jgi:hypothetical protein
MKGRQMAVSCGLGSRLPGTPRNDVSDIGALSIEPDRRHHEIEQLAGAPDEGQALEVLVAARRLAHEHHPRLRVAVGEHEAGGGGFQRAAVEAFEDRAQLVETRRGLGRLPRRRHRGVGGRRRQIARAAARFEIARKDFTTRRCRGGLGAVDRRRLNRRSRSRDRRRRIGEPIDRRLAEQRVDARLLVEGEQLAGGFVAVGGHGRRLPQSRPLAPAVKPWGPIFRS